MIKLIRVIIDFVILNYFSGKTNMKYAVKQAIDIGLVIKKVSQDWAISTEDKDAIVQEIRELSEAVIDFLDEIELPE